MNLYYWDLCQWCSWGWCCIFRCVWACVCSEEVAFRYIGCECASTLNEKQNYWGILNVDQINSFPPCTVIEMISSLYLYITSYYKLSSLEECEIFTAYLYNCRFYTCGQKEITLFCPVSSVHRGRINGNLADMISDILLQLNAWCPGVTSVPTVAWKQYFCRIKTFQPHMIVWKLALVC